MQELRCIRLTHGTKHHVDDLKEMEYMENISEKIVEINVNGGGGVMDQMKALVLSK